MWFDMANKKLTFPNPPKHYAFQDRNQLPYIHRVWCHLGYCKISHWRGFSSLTSFPQMGNRKCVILSNKLFSNFVVFDTLERESNANNIDTFRVNNLPYLITCHFLEASLENLKLSTSKTKRYFGWGGL